MRLKTALFVAAHTDDQVAAAGTLCKLRKQGVVLHDITFSYARPEGGDDRETVRKEYEEAMDLLGVERRTVLDFGCDDLAEKAPVIRQYLYEYVRAHEIDAAFILSSTDDHQSHAAVGKESERVMKNAVPLILRCHFPWSYRAGNADVIVPLTDDELACKIGLINTFRSQGFRYRYGDLFEHQAKADGLAVKVAAAEKFELVRAVL
jgi:hypothetical protein